MIGIESASRAGVPGAGGSWAGLSGAGGSAVALSPNAVVPAAAMDGMWASLLRGAAGSPLIARVESAFPHAVNLVVPGDAAPAWRRFAVLASGGRAAPGALLTACAGFADARAGDAVRIADGVLSLGGIRIGLTGARVQDCTVRVESRRTADGGTGSGVVLADAAGASDVVRSAGQPIPGLLAAVARPGSFVPIAEESPFSTAVRASLEAARGRFRVALGAALRGASAPSRGDAGAASADPVDGPRRALDVAVRALIGLGVGLTPSGDDYLVGALCLLSAHPGQGAAAARAAVANAVRTALGAGSGVRVPRAGDESAPAAGTPAPPDERTTPVSRHFLLAAADGAFQVDLADAARALAAGDLGAAAAAFAETARFGSTSGTDALHGLADAHVAVSAAGETVPTASSSGARPDPGASPADASDSGAQGPGASHPCSSAHADRSARPRAGAPAPDSEEEHA